MELEGNLGAFGLPDILQFLSHRKMTGILSIWREGYNIDFFIKEGRIVNSSALDRPRKLGQMLVYRGFMKHTDLQEVLISQQGVDRGKLLGQILIERELITRKTLREALKLQLEEEIWELFSWHDGQFKFEHKTEIDSSNILVEIDIEPLLIEGSRRQDEWSKIVHNIPGDEVVLTVEQLPENPESELTLSENEWMVMSLVNGFYTVGSIIDRTGLGKFETYRILNTFLSANLIKRKSVEMVDKELMKDEAAVGVARSLKSMLPEEDLEEPATPQHPSKKGLGGWFTRTKPQKESTSIQLDFISPLGAISFFVNSLYESFIATQDFLKPEESGDWVLGSLWKEILMHHPKADIICLSNGRINVKSIELIIQWEKDITKYLHDCYDESFAALTQLTRHLWKLAVDRLGDKTATRIASGVLTDFSANIRFKHSSRFELRTWIQDLLKI